MKVLYIATAYARHAGDVITPWLGETIRWLAEAGVQVEVLAPSYRGLASGEVDGVPVHRFRYAPSRLEDLTHDQTVPDRLRERRRYLALVPGYVFAGTIAAARLARRRRYDVIHVHWPIPHALFGLAARWATGAPLVYSFHGVELTWTRKDWPVLIPLLRRLIRTADAVTANSSYTASMIQRVCPRDVVRIPFGAAIPVPTPATGVGADAPIGSAARAGSPFQLLFVGRLVERKGVTVLLQALARLPAEAPPLVAHIVGDGPLAGPLRAQARELGLGERVRFHGFVPASDLAARYADCDAFVLPAIVDSKGDTEGLGVVLIEALAHGKPAIASAAGGIVDVVKNEETGLLVPPGDADALAAAILRLCSDAGLSRRLGLAGQELVRREFSWPVITDRLVSLYQSLAAT